MILFQRVTEPTIYYLKCVNRLLPQQSLDKEEVSISAADLGEATHNHNFYLFLARDEETGNCVGMATIFFQRNLTRWLAEIHDVVVDKSQRSKGIGEELISKLLAVAKEFASAKGQAVRLQLTSRPSRIAANHLYKKLGFVLTAQAEGEQGTNLYKMTIWP